jgi:catechol 2,3-dioxygenase-like lactoylglutathione lyase family enzyme
MKRTWTIIGVSNIQRSFEWYQALFGQPATFPAHDYFGQILDSDGTVLLCLHKWGAHEHPSLMNPDNGTPGNGLLLFFRVDDFDLALQRARSLVRRLEEESHLNSKTRTKEFSLRDPDGYYVTISALCGLRRDRSPAEAPRVVPILVESVRATGNGTHLVDEACSGTGIEQGAHDRSGSACRVANALTK